MRWNTWIRNFAFAAVFTVVGCNIFNPDGEGDVGNSDLLTTAQHYIQTGQYAKAMSTFDKAIRQDSSNSMAYYGYAKAAILLYKLDRLDILDDMQATAEDPTQFAFLQHNDTLLTLRMQAASRVLLVLSRLTDRDTLTQWYRYLTDSTSDAAQEDTLYAARRMFIEQYLSNADINTPGYRKRNQFPLTNFKKRYEDVLLDYTAFKLLYTITGLYDLDGNDTIDSRDALMKKLKFGSGGEGGFSIDSLSTIAGDLENDTAAAQNLNSLISGMQSGLLDASQLAGLIGAGAGAGGEEGDSSGSEAATTENLDSVIASLGDAILFYQFGDKLDNDGDGCVDEEILDEKDNDLDGFVDEDARVIPADKPDGVDNNHDGKKDPLNPPIPFPAGNDSTEAPAGDLRYPARPYVLGFVHAYLDSVLVPNTSMKEADLGDANLTTWVKIKKNSPSDKMQMRLALQKDSLVVRIGNGPVPDSLAQKLSNAKADVGGCWRNY